MGWDGHDLPLKYATLDTFQPFLLISMFMKGLAVALSFLTVLPVRRRLISDEEPAGSISLFPVVGFILGLIYALIAYVTLRFLPPTLAALLVLCSMVALTGGFHLDGLTDTFDGLALGKSREEILRIMKESTIGTFGVLALVMIILLKWVALWELLKRGLYYPLFVAPAWGRWALVCLAATGKPAKKEGLGAWIIHHSQGKSLITATAWAVIFMLLVHIKGVLHILWLYPALMGYRWFWEGRMGGVTGDVMGASCEMTETLILLLCLTGI